MNLKVFLAVFLLMITIAAASSAQSLKNESLNFTVKALNNTTILVTFNNTGETLIVPFQAFLNTSGTSKRPRICFCIPGEDRLGCCCGWANQGCDWCRSPWCW
jgi:hypothetical protein